MKRFVPTSAIGSLMIGAFLLLVPSRTAAETIRLNQGIVALDSEGPLAFVFGSSAFGVQQIPIAAIEWAGIGFGMGCAFFPPGGGCAPGALLDLNNNTSGTVSFGHGNAVVNGTLHSNVEFTGDWHFTSPGARIPTSDAEFVHVSAPFRFTGTLAGRTGDGKQIFNVDLTGFGLASENLQRVEGVYLTEEASALFYKFTGTDPVPEPTSLLLLATGGAALVARRRLNSGEPSR